jgi:hypothetical protein
MTNEWDFITRIQGHLPLFLITPTVIAAVIITFIGFCKRGVNFFKFGFGDTPKIPLEVASKSDINRLEADIKKIETNDLTHINNFLYLLCSILLDREIITNAQSEQLKQTLK